MRRSRKSSRTRRTSSQSRQGDGGGSTVGIDSTLAGQLGADRWIGQRQLEPIADRAMIDPELASDRPSRRDVLVQHMRLGDARRATGQAPAIALRICVMLVG